MAETSTPTETPAPSATSHAYSQEGSAASALPQPDGKSEAKKKAAAYECRGNAYLMVGAEGDAEKARADLGKALELDSSLSNVWLSLATIYEDGYLKEKPDLARTH